MATPVAPYCTSADVGALFPNLLKGGTDFADGVTSVSKAAVDAYIDWVSARIDLSLQSAGYTIPLAAMDGETWPEHQTLYVKMLTVIGVASFISAPQSINIVSKQPDKSLFSTEYERQIKDLYDARTDTCKVPLRAAYRDGSAAEKALATLHAPTTNALYGISDPMQNESFASITNRLYAMQKVYDSLKKPINWVDQIT